MWRSHIFNARVAVALLAVCAALVGCADQAAAPASEPGIVLAATSTSLFLTEDDRVSTEVTIERSGGFAGPVRLDVIGLPANVSASVAENPATGDTVTIDIVAGRGAIPGTYRLTLSATAEGIETKSLTLDLHVTATSATSVAVAFCSALAPTWVAFQDGNGDWTQATPTTVGSTAVYRRLFVTNRGGIATLTPQLDGALTLLSVLFGAPAELASAGDTNAIDCGDKASKSLLGRIDGFGVNESASISAGPFLHLTVPSSATTFRLTDLPSGPHDLLATRTTFIDGSAAVTRLLLRRDIDLLDGATLPPLDFASAEAVAPAIATVTIAGLGPEGAISGTRLRTSTSEMVLSFATDVPTVAARPYFALPESRLIAGDVQVLHVSTNGPSEVNRDADLYFRSPIDRTVSLGAPMIVPAISTVATSPSLRLRARFVPQADYDRSTSILFLQAATSAVVNVSMTAAYAALGDGFDLVVPDFSSVTGFDPAWALRPGGTVTWAATRVGGSLALGRDAIAFDGATQRRAFVRDTITPPR